MLLTPVEFRNVAITVPRPTTFLPTARKPSMYRRVVAVPATLLAGTCAPGTCAPAEPARPVTTNAASAARIQTATPRQPKRRALEMAIACLLSTPLLTRTPRRVTRRHPLPYKEKRPIRWRAPVVPPRPAARARGGRGAGLRFRAPGRAPRRPVSPVSPPPCRDRRGSGRAAGNARALPA